MEDIELNLAINLEIERRVKARNLQAMEQVAKECRERCVETLIIPVDLCKPDAVNEIKEKVGNREIGLLVNNAGYAIKGQFIEVPLQDHLDMICVMNSAVVSLTHTFLPAMVKRHKGGVIILSSEVGFQAVPGWSIYAASKAFSLLFGEALHSELSGTGVCTITVCPGFVKTQQFQERANVSLRKMVPILSPFHVVELSLNKLGKKRMIIPGFDNKSLVFFERFLPRSWVTCLVKFYLKNVFQ